MIYGIVGGLGCIALSMGLYLTDKELVLSFWIFTGYVWIIALKIVSVIRTRIKLGGLINFRQAVRSAFLVSVVGLLIWMVFNAILFSYIDPELIELSKDKAVERTTWLMNISGLEDYKQEDILNNTARKDYTPNFRDSASNYALQLIVGFLYAAIIAGLFTLADRQKLLIQEHSTD